MCIEIEVLFSIIRVVRMWCVVYWLVQLASLTMVACSNVQWQGSNIQQCRMDGGTRCAINVELYTRQQFALYHYKQSPIVNDQK